MPVSLISALVVTLALAFTGLAFAGDVTKATTRLVAMHVGRHGQKVL